jgi:hypothetical protein
VVLAAGEDSGNGRMTGSEDSEGGRWRTVRVRSRRWRTVRVRSRTAESFQIAGICEKNMERKSYFFWFLLCCLRLFFLIFCYHSCFVIKV